MRRMQCSPFAKTHQRVDQINKPGQMADSEPTIGQHGAVAIFTQILNSTHVMNKLELYMLLLGMPDETPDAQWFSFSCALYIVHTVLKLCVLVPPPPGWNKHSIFWHQTLTQLRWAFKGGSPGIMAGMMVKSPGTSRPMALLLGLSEHETY
jgi:hypothetical protein